VSRAEAIVVFLLSAGIGATVAWLALTLRNWGKAPGPATQANGSGPAPITSDAARRWQALPGNDRMELGDTGFAITLHTDLTGPLYCLWTPEGRLVGTNGFDLPQCKAWGERLARERDEFVCTEHTALRRMHH
jgi:hypothetical protein